MNLIPYYMTKRVLSATVCHKKGLDTICVDMNMKVGARVEGDCLVVEPLVSVYGSACDVHDKDGSHPHRSCGQLECSLRLRVMEVLGLDSDPVGFKSYGWKVSGSPSSVFAALDKRFRCQAHRLEDDVDGNWVGDRR